MKLFTTNLFALGAASLFGVGAASAAVLKPVSITTSPGTNTATDAEILTGITLPGDVVLDVITPANYVSGEPAAAGTFAAGSTPTATPADVAAFLSNANLSEGVINISSDPTGANGPKWTFGQAVGLDEVMYLFEVQAGGSNDDITLGLTDSSNTYLGFSLEIVNIGGSGDRLVNIDASRSVGGGIGGGAVGVTFTAADFTDGSGAAFAGTNAFGLVVLDSDGTDLTSIGIASVIPEPASLGLLAAGAVLLAGRRRHA